jgi:hypothetical protein
MNMSYAMDARVRTQFFPRRTGCSSFDWISAVHYNLTLVSILI